MKVAIIGANGQLGSDIYKSFILEDKYKIFPLSHKDIELSNYDSIKRILLNIKPNIIINTAAFHNVALCETEKEKAFEINSTGVRYLSEISNKLSSILIHISTDYVFDGKKNTPYTEEDVPNPLNIYGLSKLEGEKWIERIAKKYYILRVAALYGETPSRIKGYNFITLMLKLSKEKDEIKVVDDEITTPTWTKDISNQLKVLVEYNPKYGIYHATAEGYCSWFEFAKAIFEIKKVRINIKRASSEEFDTKVKRPKYSVLENKKLKENQINIFKHWKDSLIEYLNLIS